MPYASEARKPNKSPNLAFVGRGGTRKREALDAVHLRGESDKRKVFDRSCWLLDTSY